MGQPHTAPAMGRSAALHSERPGTPPAVPHPRRRESRGSPWSDAQDGVEGVSPPAEMTPEITAEITPEITAPFLATVLARVAASLCGPDRDDPQA